MIVVKFFNILQFFIYIFNTDYEHFYLSNFSIDFEFKLNKAMTFFLVDKDCIN